MQKILFFILVSFLLLLVGCQTTEKKISLKEAKTITAKYRSTSFTPPPKSINDLLLILEQPSVAPEKNLAEHCQGKERDGRWVGIFKEYLTHYKPEDLIDTNEHPVGGWGFKYAWNFYRGISISEIRRGNLDSAEKAQQDYLAAIPRKKRGAYIPGYAQLAIIQVSRGDLEQAESSIQESLRWSEWREKRKEPKPIFMAWQSYAQGLIAKAKGQLKQAETFFRKAISLYTQFKIRAAQVAVVKGQLALVLSDQGRLLEAENEARSAIAHSIKYERIGHVSQAPSIFQFAKILIEQGRFKEAEKIAASALWIYQNKCSPSDSIEFAEARRVLAKVHALMGNYDKSLSLYHAIKKALGEKTLKYTSRFDNDLTLSYSLINKKNYTAALTRLTKTVQQLSQSHGKEHPLTAEANGFLAIAQWQSGDKLQADKNFRQSIDILIDPTRRSGVSPHHLRLIIEAYMDISSEQAKDDVGQADYLFKLSESLRNSSVQESISAMGARAAVSTPQLAKLLRQEQNTRITIKALEATYTNAIANGIDASYFQTDINQLRLAQKALLNEISEKFPDYAQLMHPLPLNLTKVQNLLMPDEAVISTYSSENKTYIWTIVRDRAPHFSVSSLGKKDIKQNVESLLTAFAPTSDSLSSVPEFNIDIAHDLFQQILQPSEKVWGDKATLFTVAHSALGHLPLAVLTTEKMSLAKEEGALFSRYQAVPFLAKKYAIASLPSASALEALRLIKTKKTQRIPFIAFGDPWFNQDQAIMAEKEKIASVVMTRGIKFRATPELKSAANASIAILPRLPETANELTVIAKALGANVKNSLFLGKYANEALVKSKDLTQAAILAFATHGLVAGDLDGLTQPALALSSPKVSGAEGDGLLTMDEIMNLNLNADWVILSACNTGSSDGSDAEAVSGLGRAFFYAGARSLLVSNWPVETQSAMKLTTGIFSSKNYSKNRAKALQQSILDTINGGVYKKTGSKKLIYSYAHPIFWAPFSIVGDIR